METETLKLWSLKLTQLDAPWFLLYTLHCGSDWCK